VSVLDSHSGRVLRTVGVGRDPALVAVDGPTGRVLVVHGWGGPGSADADAMGSGSGGTDILDARTGTVLATVAAGAVAPEALWLVAHPQLIAVDERHGRAYVLDRPPGARPGRATMGRVSVIDDRRAQVVRQLGTGYFTVGVALDAAAGRLYVLHQYAACRARTGVWDRIVATLRAWAPLLPPASDPAAPATVACADHGDVSVYDLARL
jgi:DNA-binding beta-propeller fold protein YncE